MLSRNALSMLKPMQCTLLVSRPELLVRPNFLSTFSASFLDDQNLLPCSSFSLYNANGGYRQVYQ